MIIKRITMLVTVILMAIIVVAVMVVIVVVTLVVNAIHGVFKNSHIYALGFKQSISYNSSDPRPNGMDESSRHSALKLGPHCLCNYDNCCHGNHGNHGNEQCLTPIIIYLSLAPSPL